MDDIQRRRNQTDILMLDKDYRGKTCPPYQKLPAEELEHPIYPEHDTTYLQECLENLKEKGIEIF